MSALRALAPTQARRRDTKASRHRWPPRSARGAPSAPERPASAGGRRPERAERPSDGRDRTGRADPVRRSAPAYGAAQDAGEAPGSMVFPARAVNALAERIQPLSPPCLVEPRLARLTHSRLHQQIPIGAFGQLDGRPRQLTGPTRDAASLDRCRGHDPTPASALAFTAAM